MRLSRKFGGLLAAAMMAAGLTAAAAPARASSPYYQIKTFYGVNGPPDECVQGDFGGSLGTSVTQHYCDPTFTQTDQLWQPISLGGNGYKFMNVATNMCLEARYGAVNAMPVALWFCDSTESNTNWAWNGLNGNTFNNQGVIQSRVSGTNGYCLDVPGASTAIGLSLQLYHCNNTYAQGFLIIQPF
jgi:Ricin-type beta-trefoil lectin domain-like